MKKSIRVMLVEDNREYRDAIIFAMERAADIDLISQFGTAEIALRSLQSQAPRDMPDIVLLDLNLPGISGIDALPWFKEYTPKTKIIVLTQSDSEADILAAISAGAAGYLLKSSTIDQIKDGIHTVVNDGSVLDAKVARFILDSMKGRPKVAKLEKDLSEREIEILVLLAEGHLKKEISDQLNLGYSTIDTHVRHIYEKLEVQNAPAAVHKAHVLGLFPPHKGE